MAGRLSLIGIAILYLVLTVEAAVPETWSGFYTSSAHTRPTERTGGVDGGICYRAIIAAQERHAIPDNLLLAIGIQEAGRQMDGALTIWPWTANVQGKGAFFDSKAALESWVQATRERGLDSIDVGCMQINQKWHAHHFASLSEATDPAKNVEYAARFLRSLYSETRDWWEAAGRYHSSTPNLKATYLGKLRQNQRLANSGVLNDRGVDVAGADRTVQPSVNWSADMTGSGAKVMRQVTSIYTATPLQPILPNYQRQN